jgi:hypothetical protein
MSGSVSNRKLLTGALLALALGACHQIAGIEDRVLDPEQVEEAPSPQCKEYCTTVMEACTGKLAVYTSDQVCLNVCKLLDPGDALEPVGNTVACRIKQAELAELEPAEHCKSAGPGGNGECGTDCEAYCQLFPQTCASEDRYKNEASCLKACAGLTDNDRYDVDGDHEGDTIECRLMHVSSAAVLPNEHCSHAPIQPTKPWCKGKDDEEPTCDEYCNIHLQACDGELTQYESRQQCLDVCGGLTRGTNDDEAGNTVACRRYHSFSSTLDPDSHCYHAGPTGDGHCGDAGLLEEGSSGNCDSYCQLLAAACPDELDAMGGAGTCFETCLGLDEAARDSEYSIDNAKLSTGLSCRVLNVARAFQDKTACSAAVGGAPCAK